MTDIASLGIRVSTQGVRQSEAELRGLTKEADRAEAQAVKLGKAWGIALGAGAAALIVGGVKAIISATVEAEKVQARLENRVKTLGSSSAASVKEVDRLATALQAVSTFDDESLKSAATSLLAFNNIKAENFERAMRSIADVAADTGADVEATADKIGKALNNPLTGLRSLRDIGIELSASQKGVVKSLLETGKTSQAQAIILAELEKRYKGAAEAARNTLGGAVQGLKNDFENLLEGDGNGNGVRGTTEAINDLAETMRSPATKQGFAQIVNGVFDVITAIAKAIPYLVEFNEKLGEAFGLSGNNGKRKGNVLDFVAGTVNGIAALARGDFEGARGARRRQQAGFDGSELPDFSTVTGSSGGLFDGVKGEFRGVSQDDGPLVKAKKPKGPRKPRGESESAIENARQRFEDMVGGFQSELSGPLQRAEVEHLKNIREINEAAKAGKVSHDALAGALTLEGQAYEKSTQDIKAQLESQVAGLSGPLAEAEDRHKQNLQEIDELTKQLGLTSEKTNALRDEEAKRYDKETRAIEAQLDPFGQLVAEKRQELQLLQLSGAARDTAIDLMRLEGEATGEQAAELQRLNEEYERSADAIGDQREAMDSIRDATKGLFRDLKEGVNIWDAIGHAIDRVADKIFDLAAENVTDSLFGRQGTSGQGSSGGDWLGSLLGMFFGSGGGGGGGGSTGSGSVFNGSFAKGAAFDKGVSYFAKGDVFDRATAFPMRGGTGVLGEAGPEAILPLHRGPDGKLGVRMEMPKGERASPGGVRDINVTQVIQGRMDRKTASIASRETGKEARREMSRTG